MKHIQNVLNHRPKSTNEYSFNMGSNIISNNAVTTLLNKFLLENKINKYTLHSLRQTHASMLLA